jgi:hypothetical protein
MDSFDLLDTALPESRAIQRLWHSKKIGERLPVRGDFSIDDLRPWLGRLILADVEIDGTIRYRVHGTTCAEKLGQELTGKTVNEIRNEKLRELIRTDYADVIASRVPTIIRRRRDYGDKGTYELERLLLPLSTGGERVDQILSLLDWVPGSHRPRKADSWVGAGGLEPEAGAV